ncbi:IclR family transcriptional regulator [Acididesulfobacillus acetoxydans]|uniref:IclR family transcriptional regulator n=1 Tax=Acididesulfobacillus acetoxydans TaxID=1561005 RepID=UPI001F0FA045|nr:IclR family transcriptional regulator [Acididesulfobacillus acetoxydans]
MQTVDRALMVLLAFTNEKPVWGITELSQEFGLAKSIIHRLLSSLQHYGFVEADPVTRKYSLGPKALVLGRIAANQMSLRKVSLPVMQNLADLSGESVILTIQDGMSGVAIEIVEGTQAITWKTSLGNNLPLHCGASKKILLAFQPPEFIEQYLKSESLVRLSDQKLMQAEALREELAYIREKGIAVTFGEVDLGVTALATPIFNEHRKIIAGLSIGGPSFRFTPENLATLSQLAKQAAATISDKLGCISKK